MQAKTTEQSKHQIKAAISRSKNSRNDFGEKLLFFKLRCSKISNAFNALSEVRQGRIVAYKHYDEEGSMMGKGVLETPKTKSGTLVEASAKMQNNLAADICWQGCTAVYFSPDAVLPAICDTLKG